ncbi:MAG TPA: hypothetical protein VF104_07150, partial [Burkholderiales bacterium]
LGVSVRANSSLGSDLWAKAVFEVPMTGTRDSGMVDNPDPPLQVLVVPERQLVELRPGGEVTFETPEVEHLRCRDYWVTVMVYGDRRAGNAVGEHRQGIYSRLDGTRIRSSQQLNEALASERGCAP